MPNRRQFFAGLLAAPLAALGVSRKLPASFTDWGVKLFRKQQAAEEWRCTWCGHPVGHVPEVNELWQCPECGIYGAGNEPYLSGVAIARVGERSEALAFFNGDQWPAEVEETRREQGRPCLVFNKLPELVERAFNGLKAHDAAKAAVGMLETPRATPERRAEMILQAVRNNRDTQTMHNYSESCRAELRSGQNPTWVGLAPIDLKWYLDVPELGHVHITITEPRMEFVEESELHRQYRTGTMRFHRDAFVLATPPVK